MRRKRSDSIAWQDTEPQQTLQAYDSILTLDQSSAKIKLHGDVQITLHENTLIVLEPLENDQPIVNFNDGLILSKIKQKSLKLGAKNWTIEAQPGTQLSLKSLAGEKLEIEVTDGEINLENTKTNQKQRINKNTILQTNAQEIIEQSLITEKLSWVDTEQKVYSHIFPLNFPIQWSGKATSLHIEDTQNNTEIINVIDFNLLNYMVYPGTYSFRLFNKENESSEKLIVEVLDAPIIQYYSPLPRERFATNTPILFNWTHLKQASLYKLEFSNNEFFENVLFEFDSKNNYNLKLENEHELYWQVKAIDENGFTIPALYRYKLYNTNNPFAAPQIKKVKVRDPASDEFKEIKRNNDKNKKSNEEGKTSQFKMQMQQFALQCWHLLFPVASAEEIKSRDVKFEWEIIKGADYYLLEVSSNPNFLNPDLNIRVYKNNYVWREHFKHENYFIRIAAGDENGRLGLFSTPQLINLSEIEVNKETKEAKILTEEDLKKLTPINYDDKTLEEIEKQKIVFRKLEIPSKPENSILEPEFLLQLNLATNYNFLKFEAKDDFEAKHQGLIPFSSHIYIQTRQWIQQLQLQFIEWKPKNDYLLFQKNMESFTGEFHTYFRWAKYHGVGINYHYLAWPERKSHEELQLNNYDLLGITYVFNYQKNNWSSLSQFDYAFSSESQLISVNQRTYKKMGTHPWQFLLGGQIKVQYFKMDSANGFLIQPGAFVGVEW